MNNTEYELSNIDEQQLISIFNDVKAIDSELSNAKKMAVEAKNRAQLEKGKKTRHIFNKKDIDSLKDAVEMNADANSAILDVVDKISDNQKKLAILCNRFLEFGFMNIAHNRATIKFIESVMAGNAGKTLTEETKLQLTNVIRDLKQKEDFLSRQERQGERINEHTSRINCNEGKINEHALRINKNEWKIKSLEEEINQVKKSKVNNSKENNSSVNNKSLIIVGIVSLVAVLAIGIVIVFMAAIIPAMISIGNKTSVQADTNTMALADDQDSLGNGTESDYGIKNSDTSSQEIQPDEGSQKTVSENLAEEPAPTEEATPTEEPTPTEDVEDDISKYLDFKGWYDEGWKDTIIVLDITLDDQESSDSCGRFLYGKKNDVTEYKLFYVGQRLFEARTDGGKVKYSFLVRDEDDYYLDFLNAKDEVSISFKKAGSEVTYFEDKEKRKEETYQDYNTWRGVYKYESSYMDADKWYRHIVYLKMNYDYDCDEICYSLESLTYIDNYRDEEFDKEYGGEYKGKLVKIADDVFETEDGLFIISFSNEDYSRHADVESKRGDTLFDNTFKWDAYY